MAANTDYLRPGLKKWMIFFIVITSVIGGGIFNKGGSAMKIAGPGGALLAFTLMSVVAICVSECISELVQLFPISNAIVEYVRKFIDEDLGWAIGIAYWLTYSSIFAAQNMTAAHLAEYWGGKESQTYRIVIFYGIAPLFMLLLNVLGVEKFGWIESIAGGLKLLLVVGTTIALYVMAGDIKPKWLNDGFQHNPAFINTDIGALCYVLPIMAFGFIGIETITVTAFEAKPDHLRWPSRYTVYFAAVAYLLCMLGQCLNVSWMDDHLPTVYGGTNTVNERAIWEDGGLKDPSSQVLAVIAIFNWGRKSVAGFLNAAIIFSVLSASNTTLYIASRTLYGMALRITDQSLLGNFAHSFCRIDEDSKVPMQALLTSFAMFSWVPFVSLKRDYKFQYVIEIIQASSSVSCLIVWTALCLSYLRFWWWQRKIKDDFNKDGSYEVFNRRSEKSEAYGAKTPLMSLQPFPAIVAILGCVTIFAFCSATWWYQPPTLPKVAIAYAAQFIVLIIFVLLKVRRWLKPKSEKRPDDTDFGNFTRIVMELRGMMNDEEEGKGEGEGEAAGGGDREQDEPVVLDNLRRRNTSSVERGIMHRDSTTGITEQSTSACQITGD